MANLAKQYERFGTVTIEEFISLAKVQTEEDLKNKQRVTVLGQKVGTHGLRVQTFVHKGTNCSCCGLEGQYFAVERHKNRKTLECGYHVNLWGVHPRTGVEILFTHDHTLSRANGGEDSLSNTTTMCAPCNSKKGELEQYCDNPVRTINKVRKYLTDDNDFGHTSKEERRKIAKEKRRQGKIDRMFEDLDYRRRVEENQVRLGRNDFPEVFGRIENQSL